MVNAVVGAVDTELLSGNGEFDRLEEGVGGGSNLRVG
jgi:hypothetical protein